VATTPTPGPSEPRREDAARTQGDSKADTATAPDDPDATIGDSTPQVDSADAENPSAGVEGDSANANGDSTGATDDSTSANGDRFARPDPPQQAKPPADGSAGSARVTPADLVAATRGAGSTGRPDTGGDATLHTETNADDGASTSQANAGSGTEKANDVQASAPSAEPTETIAHDEWGRVDVNGEVYLRTADGERHIGSWQVGEPGKALEFYRRKFDDLVVQVDLLEQRLSSGATSPDNAEQGIAKLRKALTEPHAIGDLDSLRARLETLREQVSERRAERKAARAQELDEARASKERVASEAEQISEGDDWRHGADRLRQLLDQWKSLPRLDRATDDALWRRFSTARTHYTRRRKAHFAELAERREGAREIKEEILAEAEELAESTDWGATARRFRELMSRWKAAGPAPRSADEALWKRFRAAQDTFFESRSATFAQRDAEQQGNLEAKEALLADAEGLLPVSDWKAARASLRSIQERWEAIGHVPRESMKSIESRLRRVEDAIRDAEQSDWRRTNPEARARAEGTVAQLQTSISELETQASKAREAGNERKASEAEEALAARRAWLEQAERALDDLR
jgi:hypothetical protein